MNSELQRQLTSSACAADTTRPPVAAADGGWLIMASAAQTAPLEMAPEPSRHCNSRRRQLADDSSPPGEGGRWRVLAHSIALVTLALGELDTSDRAGHSTPYLHKARLDTGQPTGYCEATPYRSRHSTTCCWWREVICFVFWLTLAIGELVWGCCKMVVHTRILLGITITSGIVWTTAVCVRQLYTQASRLYTKGARATLAVTAHCLDAWRRLSRKRKGLAILCVGTTFTGMHHAAEAPESFDSEL